MRDVGPWAVFGFLSFVVGFALIFAVGESDGFALGGAGLIVLGAVCAAVSFDDRTGQKKPDEPHLPVSASLGRPGAMTILGLVSAIAGLVLVFVDRTSDGFALGGSGLLGIGVICAAMALDDRRRPRE